MQHKASRKRPIYRRYWLKRSSLYLVMTGIIVLVFWAGFATKTVMSKSPEFEPPTQETKNSSKDIPIENQYNYPTPGTKTPTGPVQIGFVTTLDVLDTSEIKSYMDYKKITDRTSPQWEFIHTKKGVIVNNDGYLVTSDGYIGVALGSYFGKVGTKYLFELDSGKTLKLIKVEEKDNRDTCDNHYMADDGSVIEFVIDPEKMRDHIWSNGLIWQGNFNNNPDFNGKIKSIWRVEEKE